ncbi:MAG: crAss001_48 related protein [Fusobacteriaceae bacterium]
MTHIERMELEFSGLNEKIIEIQYFLEEEENETRCKAQIFLLRKQLEYMLSYRDILSARINVAEDKIELGLKDSIDNVCNKIDNITNKSEVEVKKRSCGYLGDKRYTPSVSVYKEHPDSWKVQR